MIKLKMQTLSRLIVSAMQRVARPDIDIIGLGATGTDPGWLQQHAHHSPDTIAYSENCDGGLRNVTWTYMACLVRRYRVALDRAGLATGDRVAIMLADCVGRIAFDIAAMETG